MVVSPVRSDERVSLHRQNLCDVMKSIGTDSYGKSCLGFNAHDAYALCSIAASFRVTQVVDIVRGVHAMIPKNLFTGELRRQIVVV